MDSCQMEIVFLDPDTYTSISDHEMRQRILVGLFNNAFHEPITKQELADILKIKYTQLVYQLNNHLQEFWEVKKEEKVRGTRMEYIGPTNRNAVYLAIGAGGKIFVADPVAEIFGPVSEVGLRCDTCSAEESESCIRSLIENGFNVVIDEGEVQTLERNCRFPPYRPLDLALITALRQMVAGETCHLTIPCESCHFLRRQKIIQLDNG
ncbi:MAG TPA: hypothetical protein HA366_02100 [Candidatus Methanomethylophilaceae archaeon]|nr:hypothetical protein [Candidatus Methanomethylophilaceae archaeon]